MPDQYQGEERRAATKGELDECRADVDLRLNEHSVRLQTIEANTQATLDIVSAWNNARGFVNVIRWLSATVRVLALPATVMFALWYFMKTGHLPPGFPPK